MPKKPRRVPTVLGRVQNGPVTRPSGSVFCLGAPGCWLLVLEALFTCSADTKVLSSFTIPSVPDPKPIQTLRVALDAAGQRLDQWLVAQLSEISRVRVQQLVEQGKILVNGKAPKSSLKLRGGEEIAITGAVELPPLRAFAEDIPLDVVYEDGDIAVVNKPAGMAVHAGSGKDDAGSRGTLVNALLHRFGGMSQVGGELRPGIVHRLDKDTSGLVVVAKTDAAHRKLARQFARREVKKTYLALAH